MAFIVVDILAVTSVLKIGSINPFWKFSFVFKCLTDTIILDDFKTALDKLSKYKLNQIHLDQIGGSKHNPSIGWLENLGSVV